MTTWRWRACGRAAHPGSLWRARVEDAGRLPRARCCGAGRRGAVGGRRRRSANRRSQQRGERCRPHRLGRHRCRGGGGVAEGRAGQVAGRIGSRRRPISASVSPLPVRSLSAAWLQARSSATSTSRDLASRSRSPRLPASRSGAGDRARGARPASRSVPRARARSRPLQHANGRTGLGQAVCDHRALLGHGNASSTSSLTGRSGDSVTCPARRERVAELDDAVRTANPLTPPRPTRGFGSRRTNRRARQPQRGSSDVAADEWARSS
jgi:hypothetical protein